MVFDNNDLFFDFYNKVKDSKDVNEIIKEFGGGNIYIPSYKTTFRNDDMLNEYNELLALGKSQSVAIRELSINHNLSQSMVQKIIRETKEAKEPTLF